MGHDLRINCLRRLLGLLITDLHTARMGIPILSSEPWTKTVTFAVSLELQYRNMKAIPFFGITVHKY